MDESKPPVDKEPVSQEKPQFRKGWPGWIQEMPRLSFPPPDENFQLIKEADLREVLKDSDPAIVDEMVAKLREIDHEIMRLFRERDFEASQQQNSYRLYQLGYMFLATAATFFGSTQALAFGSNPDLVATFAFLQTIISALAVFLSFISTREPPLPRWMEHRRRAEFLRREYFRYLMGLPPYSDPTLKPHELKRELGVRAAKANNGSFPAEDQ
jgi:hypothetical protein